MKKYCPLCGSVLNEDGTCPNNHVVLAMCLNCTFCSELDNGDVVCENTENLMNAKEKILAGIAQQQSEGYAIKKVEVEIEPLPLKKPTLKCKRWTLNEELVIDEFRKHINPTTKKE